MSDDDAQTVLVTGATSLIGRYLLPSLADNGMKVVAVSRRKREDDNAAHWVAVDINDLTADDEGFLKMGNKVIRTVIHLAPLTLLPPLLPYFRKMGVRRIVAFGTTSRFTKERSLDRGEQALARSFIEAEEKIRANCLQLGMQYTLLRPTVIYDPGQDKNISLLARFIQRYHFFPLVGPGCGKRQPVHAADLASACVAVLNKAETCGKVYNLTGPEVLTYRDMVVKIFEGLGRRPRFIRIPSLLWKFTVPLMRVLPRYRELNLAMINRMNQDLCFDSVEARRDFGYDPKGFHFSI